MSEIILFYVWKYVSEETPSNINIMITIALENNAFT